MLFLQVHQPLELHLPLSPIPRPYTASDRSGRFAPTLSNCEGKRGNGANVVLSGESMVTLNG
jgi:hypothetical protein